MELHNALTRGQLSAAMQRALGVSFDSAGIERYGETMQPVLDLWRQPEHSILRGDFRWAGQESVAAAVGEFAIWAVGNAPGSGGILVLERVGVRSGVAVNQIVAGIATRSQILVTLAAALAPNPIGVDNRNSGPNEGTSARVIGQVEFFDGTDAASLPGTLIDAVEPNGTTTAEMLNLPVILKPGTCYYVEQLGANVNLRVSSYGRWRKALPGELFV